jgi:hypothetical protein
MGHSVCGDYTWCSARHRQDLITGAMLTFEISSSVPGDPPLAWRCAGHQAPWPVAIPIPDTDTPTPWRDGTPSLTP